MSYSFWTAHWLALAKSRVRLSDTLTLLLPIDRRKSNDKREGASAKLEADGTRAYQGKLVNSCSCSAISVNRNLFIKLDEEEFISAARTPSLSIIKKHLRH